MIEKHTQVRGLSVLNPTDIEEEYLLRVIEYAREKDYDHVEVVGAIHNFRHGNIDGITPYKKYAIYNADKDSEYIDRCIRALGRATALASKYGIKTYIWHHELDLPDGFEEDHPEALNLNGDIEITHPIVKDFLENKISDFFDAYPEMSGIVLTLHETKVPLLKLQNQILGKKERVIYVLRILYNACTARGKELIVRSFASVEEDSDMMLAAIEAVSPDMPIMDKWTQFDWPLTLPPNKALLKIKNPLIIETDISGEYFGKNRIPAMVTKHIAERFEFCDKLHPLGYVHRIDRNGQKLFDSVNEVNLETVNAFMHGEAADAYIDAFFKCEYGEAAEAVKALMLPTQELMEMLLHNRGYYFMQGSYFPDLNHSKNHFYFEMMRRDFCIASDEWFVKRPWDRGEPEDLIAEKEELVERAGTALNELLMLKGKMSDEKYSGLLLRFKNLYYAALLFSELLNTFINYVRSFESGDDRYEQAFYENLRRLDSIDDEGRRDVNDKNYYGNFGHYSTNPPCDIVKEFIAEIPLSFEAEKRKTAELRKMHLTDFVVCGGGLEGHKLKKEVNFSDTAIHNGELCRLPGNNRGGGWSRINAHGWFSYEVSVIPNFENEITLELGTLGERLAIKVTYDGKETVIDEPLCGKKFVKFYYKASDGEGSLRIRFDRINTYTPLVYSIRVK